MPAFPATPTDERESELLAIAQRARAFLEPLWIHYLGDPWWAIDPPLSRGACRVSSEFLARILPDLGLRGWSVHGGPESFLQEDGERVPHYWLSDGTDIIDITADQFGLPAVIVGRPDLSRYIPGPAPALSAKAQAEVRFLDAWVEAWRDRDGVPFPSAMSSKAVEDYSGPLAHALALALHLDAGLPLLAAGGRSGRARPLAGDGDPVLDATGLLPWEAYARRHGLAPDDLEPMTADGLRARFGAVDESMLMAARAYAQAQPALSNAISQAAYAALEQARDDEGAEEFALRL